ncbi:regulatory protein RecX [Formicincola oecophyllae]|uniref:Regulatory protein RecX n=1 Tax=Formicincola oecophyllae TaxID=2558361 RepID=A0A4Y6U8U9_9PROT|nr:RecX family transcriptional regulator [Formicincola oecophyllae]QDH13430.1 regulatory protein RecX [Formicincola oecophyllae]
MTAPLRPENSPLPPVGGKTPTNGSEGIRGKSQLERGERPQPRRTKIPRVPDENRLREQALRHVERFAATRASLEGMLERYLARWAVRATRAGMEADLAQAHAARLAPLAATVAESLEKAGVVDDAAFSRSRARSLTRSGRSRLAVKAHLKGRGVSTETMENALEESLGEVAGPGQQSELAAALVLARKRKLGPFALRAPPEMEGEGAEDPEEGLVDDGQPAHLKALKEQRRVTGVFARAGFAMDVAQRVLDMDLEEAEERILQFRSGTFS